MLPEVLIILIVLGVICFFGTLAMIVKLFQKVEQGKALVVNGWRGTKVTFSGIVVYPVIERSERMDISVKANRNLSVTARKV